MRRKAGDRKGDLTPLQKQVLVFINHQGLTIKQVADKLGITTQAVYKVVKRLRERGFVVRPGGGVSSFAPPKFVGRGVIRLHGQRILLPAPKGTRYEELRRGRNSVLVRGALVNFHRDVVELVSRGVEFYGDSPEEALERSLSFWEWVVAVLERDFNIVLLKDRRGFRRALEHYARVDSRVAGEVSSKLYRVRGSKDGKTWLLFDASKGFPEYEAVDGDVAFDDMRLVKPYLDELEGDDWGLWRPEDVESFLNDLRDNRPPKLSEQAKLLLSVVRLQRETNFYLKEVSAGLAGLLRLLQPPVLSESSDDVVVDYVG